MEDTAVVVFNLELVRFRWIEGPGGAGSVHVLSPSGELLAATGTAGLVEREAVFQVLEEGARNGQVRRGGRWCRLGWFNPLTGQVSIGALPDTVVYDLGIRELPDGELVGTVTTAGLVLDGDAVPPAGPPSLGAFIALMAAHRNGIDLPSAVGLPGDLLDHEPDLGWGELAADLTA